MWGGIGPNGAAVVCFHDRKKISVDEWVKAVDSGKLASAIAKVAIPQSAFRRSKVSQFSGGHAESSPLHWGESFAHSKSVQTFSFRLSTLVLF